MHSTITRDLTAALIGALAVLPQAIAYGLIAVYPLGLDYAVFGVTAGLGTSVLFGLVTGIFGSNSFLVSGPRAITALVFATAITNATLRGIDDQGALFLAFTGIVFAGLFQILAGLLRLGYLVSYVPVPVLAGFVNASALAVLLSSLPMVLGLPGMPIMTIIAGGFLGSDQWAIVVGGTVLLLCFLFEGRSRLIPATLIALSGGTVLYYLGVHYLGQATGPVLGFIDLTTVFQSPVASQTANYFGIFLTHIDIPILAGLSIGLLAAFDTVLSGSALDMQFGTKSKSNKDLVVHGAANLAMGMIGFLPGSGTLNRSTAIIRSGGKTRIANVGTAIAFAVMLVVLIPVIAMLPHWATSGMLVALAVQAVDRDTIAKLRALFMRIVPYPRVLISDLAETLTVVLVAVIFNLIAAVGVGLALAVILFVLGVGRDPVRRKYLGARVHSKTERPPSQIDLLEEDGKKIGVIELQGALFFGACSRVQAQAAELLSQGVQYLIFDFRYLSSIDSTGSALLRSLSGLCEEAGGRLLLSYVERERRVGLNDRRRGKQSRGDRRLDQNFAPRWVWLNMQANNVISTIGEDWIFDDTDRAIAECEDQLLQRSGMTGPGNTRDVIANSAVFNGLSRDQIGMLRPYVQRHRFETGDVILREGEPTEKAYLIVRGRMDVLIDIPGTNRQRRVSSLAAGTLFGEVGIFDGKPRSASVVAVWPSSCFSINEESLRRLQQNHPDIAIILLKNVSLILAHKLRMANNMISELEL